MRVRAIERIEMRFVESKLFCIRITPFFVIVASAFLALLFIFTKRSRDRWNDEPLRSST